MSLGLGTLPLPGTLNIAKSTVLNMLRFFNGTVPSRECLLATKKKNVQTSPISECRYRQKVSRFSRTLQPMILNATVLFNIKPAPQMITLMANCPCVATLTLNTAQGQNLLRSETSKHFTAEVASPCSFSPKKKAQNTILSDLVIASFTSQLSLFVLTRSTKVAINKILEH